MKRIAADFMNLFFPIKCLLCGGTRVYAEPEICSLCYISLPRELNYDGYQNTTTDRLQGMLRFERAYSLLRFSKKSQVQKLLHQLKYRGQANLGILLGKWLAAELLYYIRHDFELIVPVPLHAEKLSSRGYNQSMEIARGVGQITGHRVIGALHREHKTTTQTNLSRWERFENTAEEFSLANIDLVRNRRVLLIDDVITTGATMAGSAIPLIAGGMDQLIVAAVGLTQEI